MTPTASILILLLAMASQAQTLLNLPMPQASLAAPQPQDGANGVVNLAWTRSQDATVTGYRVKFGTNFNALNNSAGVGNVTNVTIKNLVEANAYCFTVVSVYSNNVESELSNFVTNFIQPKLTLTPHVWRASVRVPAGRTNILQASTNLVTWVNIATNTGGILTALRTNTAQEFFRVKPN